MRMIRIDVSRYEYMSQPVGQTTAHLQRWKKQKYIALTTFSNQRKHQKHITYETYYPIIAKFVKCVVLQIAPVDENSTDITPITAWFCIYLLIDGRLKSCLCLCLFLCICFRLCAWHTFASLLIWRVVAVNVRQQWGCTTTNQLHRR